MVPTLLEESQPKIAPVWARLPARMRVLYICGPRRNGRWLAEAFAADSASDVELDEVRGSHAGLERLREDAYDVVLVGHEPGELDALDLIEGLRAGGSDEPLVILGPESEQELTPLAYEVGADAYVCVNTSTTRALIWTLARAIERSRLVRDNQRLSQAERHRLQQEHHEAQRLLDEQRALIRDLEALREEHAGDGRDSELPANGAVARHAAGAAAHALPLPLVAHYRELLRTYVIMGSGNLAGDMNTLAELLVSARVSASQTMQLHLQALEELVRGLGTRSARHVMTRADLLVLEVMVHLTEGYRRRYLERRRPAQQLSLPGFDTAPPDLGRA